MKAIKEYSYMDQRPQQEIDLHDGIESTLTMLGHRLRQGVTVVREYDRSLPKIPAYGSELKDWLADAQINRDSNLRLQYLAGDAQKHGSAQKILDALVACHRAKWDEELEAVVVETPDTKKLPDE